MPVSTALSKIREGYQVLLSQWDADRFAKQDMVNPVGVGMLRLRAAELENVMNIHLTSACIVILKDSNHSSKSKICNYKIK